MKLKVKLLAHIKNWYYDAFFDLTLTQFNDLIYALKASHNSYKGNIAAKYYQMLGINYLRDKFVKTLFEKLE